MKLLDYERQISQLNCQLINYKKGFNKLTRYNNNSYIMIHNCYIDNHLWIVSVKQDFNYLNRNSHLKFELHDMLDNRPIYYFQGHLSVVDEWGPVNHKRRDHIYQKFGFTIAGDKVRLESIPMEVIIQERKKWNTEENIS
ncbi:hypothetical protein DIX59_09065 [Streptococcus iniae]|nr:hypothetical protein IUSA1_01255 [Streptococcus iniae IUSA1]KYJ81237.1 hypothetical protein NA30_04360 [Streptococcus iniae]RMI73090.1 hypothetical protein DIX59_09065 [Streptococcus iniae]